MECSNSRIGIAALDRAPPTAPPVVPAARPRLLVVTWAGLGLLLLAELLVLTIRYDVADFADRADHFGRFVAAASIVLKVAVTSAAIVLALTAWRLRRGFARTVRELGLVPGLWPWLPAHLVAFALLAHFSQRILGNPLLADWREVMAWWGAILCTGLFWLAAAMPPRFWPGLVRSGRWVLLAGFALGIGGWIVSEVARSGWESSSAPTFWAAAHLLRFIYPEVVSDPETFVLGTPSFRVMIGPACSGYEGVGLVCLYMGFYLWVFRRDLRFPHALALLPIGALAAWSLNVVRITVLVVIGDSVSPELALGGFHSQAGWLAFNAVALGLAFIAHTSRVFTRHPATLGAGANPTAAYLSPLLALVAAQMLTEALFNGSPALYPLRVLAAAAVLAYYWRSIDGLGRPSLHADGGTASRGTLWAVLIGIGVFALWEGLRVFAPSGGHPSDPRETLAGMPGWVVAAWVVFRVAGSVVIVPLVEEVAFRGYLLRRLAAADFRSVSPRHFAWPAFILSSVLFGVLHENWVAGIVAGMAYAAAYCRRGRLGDAVVAHATTNALMTIAALVSGDWQYWS